MFHDCQKFCNHQPDIFYNGFRAKDSQPLSYGLSLRHIFLYVTQVCSQQKLSVRIFRGYFMIIHPFFGAMMRYRIVQNAAEAYYRYKMKRPCFIMEQNHRWTLVTIER